MLSNVSAPALLRLSAYATPTAENNLSTEADDAGQPKYWRVMSATNIWEFNLVLFPPIKHVLLRCVFDLRQLEIRRQLISRSSRGGTGTLVVTRVVRLREEGGVGPGAA